MTHTPPDHAVKAAARATAGRTYSDELDAVRDIIVAYERAMWRPEMPQTGEWWMAAIDASANPYIVRPVGPGATVYEVWGSDILMHDTVRAFRPLPPPPEAGT